MNFDDDFDLDYLDHSPDDWDCMVCGTSIPPNSEFELCDNCKDDNLEEIYGDQTPCKFCGEPLGHEESYNDFHFDCWMKSDK
ncbi:Uncharacterised protein [Moraxella lacunata]|uniref:Uncharacterized protein n=1 Tax=Moraxella lacunata TaxID=477 RepID=A0A378TS78_MORLA|nr:hypothetical protein [Moraxella lacunata]STZ63521.1 Uncharacterised protein [Moraxella lacunata]